MSTLQRRRMMMAQGVTYDGIPLTITNVSDSNAVIEIRRYGGLAPLLYYKKGNEKTYRRWNYDKITLLPQESMDIFGDNPEGLSKSRDEYINFRSSRDISVGGRVSSLSSTIRDYNYVDLFKDANVVNIDEDLFVGVNLTPYCFRGTFSYNKNLQEVPSHLLPFTDLSTYCYQAMFEYTGIKKVPTNFLPAINALNAYSSMFRGSYVSDIEVGAVKATSAISLNSMFLSCLLENIKEGAFEIISSVGNGTFARMFGSCEFDSAPTKLTLNGRSNYVYENFFENNKNLQYVGEEFFNNLSVPLHQGRLFDSAFSNCTSLQSVSIPYGDNMVVNRPNLFLNTFKGCTLLNRIEVKFTSWTYIDREGVEQQITPNWLTDVSPTGTFICPKELAEATDGYYDEEGNFIPGVGRGINTVPEGWTIDYPIIDARDGDANAMALMAVISQQTHADGTPWVKNSLVMMKSEAEKVEDIGTVFSGNWGIRNFEAFQFFINVKRLSNRSFYYTGIKTIILPDNVILGNECFYYSSTLEYIRLPIGIDTIPNGCFFLCQNLDMTIPNTVTKIEGRAFGRTAMSSGQFREGITSIGDEAFTQNTRITDIYIPSTVTEYGYAFRSCPNINSIIVDDKNPIFDSRSGCNAVMKGTTLIEGCNNTIIPNETTSIGACAFEGRKFTNTTLDLSNTNITNIGVYCFSGSNVEKIIFPSSFVQANSVSLNTSTLHTVILLASGVVYISSSNTIHDNTFFYVPDELLDEYKSAHIWNTIADRIKPLSEYTE